MTSNLSTLAEIDAIKYKLAHSSEAVKIAALSTALKYGKEGIELLISVLKNDTEMVQWQAWDLLWSKAKDKVSFEQVNCYPLKSESGVNYRRLRNFLVNKQWQQADQETLFVMLEISNRKSEGFLSMDSIRNFPCEDLWIINELWRHYSYNKFSFSIQTNIFSNCGGIPGKYDVEVYENFINKLRWGREGKGFSYSDLTFKLNSLKAPTGHLPALIVQVWCHPLLGGYVSLATWSELAHRCAECNI